MMTLVGAIAGHLVGDYLLQTDWMASNKKKEHYPCAVHCGLWTLAVLLFSGWMFQPMPAWQLCALIMVLFFSHFIQDRTQIVAWWMKLKWKDQTQFMQPPLGPWSIIVVDNVWHIVVLWVVCRLLEV